MPRFDGVQPGEQGMSLIEVVVALGIVAALSVGVSTIMKNFSVASQSQATEISATAEMREFTALLHANWNLRKRPAGYGTGFTAASPGFVLRKAGLPCSSNCPQLVLQLQLANGTPDQVTYQTQCVSPGNVPGLTRLNSLDFVTPLGTSCAPCKAGQIPVVTVTSTAASAKNRRFPHNGAVSSAKFRINEVLGMTACFSQSGTGPLSADFMGLTVGVDASSKVLKLHDRALTLPFDNFANVRLESGT